MTPPSISKARLGYIDWMRGLACLLMFQTHCYDSWLRPQARQSRFFMYSQLGGTFPAPLFLFLAGISFALITEKLRQKNLPPGQIAGATIRRGAEIFAFGLLFRLQEYAVAWGWAPASDLFRVDILNTIGASMMMMGLFCWIVLAVSDTSPAMGERTGQGGARFPRRGLAVGATAVAMLISLVTPLLWTTWRLRFLPWPLESYIDGVHNLGTPQAWLFPLFPWSAFAFAGLAVGFLLPKARSPREWRFFVALGVAGVLLVEVGRRLDAQPRPFYPVYDFWHTSPNFFLIRLGLLMVIVTASYAWCSWGAGQWRFSPLIQLGQASLLVYWVHIEFVYGRVSILPKHSVGIRTASFGLLTIFLAMLLLAYFRTNTKGKIKERIVAHGPELLAWFRRRPARADG
ncbi:MAG TPA: heparan-alpha-glucosaminide N-acetyltransferase domain-containing protein [Verrucomicrobiae bacterium]|nr:heparan-alpha-glucosaminide N-acetyltransferase domain-containing protein [Verrucomicrobiae bacterium]